MFVIISADARDEAPHRARVQRRNGRAGGGSRARGAASDGRRRGSRVQRGKDLPRIASCMMALFLLMSLLVATVLRLERDAYSLITLLRQARKEHTPPPSPHGSPRRRGMLIGDVMTKASNH